MNADYVQYCYEAIQKGETEAEMKKNDLCFVDAEMCKTLINLQNLLRSTDHAIIDNGYHINHSSLRAPKSAPEFEETKYKVSVLSLTWRRYISFLRQVQERINVWCKRYKFCRTKIEVWDIPNVQAVWNIACADLVLSDTVLMKETEKNKKLAQRIMDMRGVSLNYASWYWRWLPSKRNKIAKISKAKSKAKSKNKNRNTQQQFREFEQEWEVPEEDVPEEEEAGIHNHNQNHNQNLRTMDVDSDQCQEPEQPQEDEESVQEEEFLTFLQRRSRGQVRKRSCCKKPSQLEMEVEEDTEEEGVVD